jgi:hypothetical protein
VYISVNNNNNFKGEEVGEVNQREVRGATVHKALSKIPTLLTVSPIYKL